MFLVKIVHFIIVLQSKLSSFLNYCWSVDDVSKWWSNICVSWSASILVSSDIISSVLSPAPAPHLIFCFTSLSTHHLNTRASLSCVKRGASAQGKQQTTWDNMRERKMLIHEQWVWLVKHIQSSSRSVSNICTTKLLKHGAKADLQSWQS